MHIPITRLFLSITAVLLVCLAWQGSLDAFGRQYAEQGFRRALITFGVARALNGVISVAQGTEVAVEPAGIGMTFTPGQILDPVNDLVERFSWVMLASGTALGIQRVLLQVTAWPWFTALTGVAVLAALVLWWWPRCPYLRLRRWIYALACMLVVLRFSIPLLAIASEGLYRCFLAPQYTESQHQLEQATQAIQQLNQENRAELSAEEEGSLLDDARRMVQSLSDSMQVEHRIGAFKRSVENVSEHAIQLIVVFILQTMVFPLVFLWLILQVLKRLAGNAFAKA